MKITKTSDSGNSALTASGAGASVNSSTTFVVDIPSAPTPHSQARICAGGTFTGATTKAEGQVSGGSLWMPLLMVRGDSQARSSGSDSPSDSTNTSWIVDIRGYSKLRVYNSAGTITSMALEVATGTQDELGGSLGTLFTTSIGTYAAGLTLSGGTGVNTVAFPDNLASAMAFVEGANKYLEFISTDGSERVKFGKSITLLDAITITNSANATGTSLWGTSDKGAFFGGTPSTRPTAYTQTYSTTTKTVPADTSHTITDSTGGVASTTALAALTLNDTLTDNTGGAASTTLAAISDTATKNAVASLAAENALIKAALTVCKNSITTLAAELVLTKADALATKKVAGALIDDLQLINLCG